MSKGSLENIIQYVEWWGPVNSQKQIKNRPERKEDIRSIKDRSINKKLCQTYALTKTLLKMHQLSIKEGLKRIFLRLFRHVPFYTGDECIKLN